MPLSTGEQLCLQQAFAPAETEMRVDDVHRAEICFNVHLDRRAIFPAEKRCCTRQLGGAAKHERVATKNRVAVVLIAPSHRGMKIAMPAKLLGNHPSLIDAGGSRSAEIELLQPDDIDRQISDHFSDARFGTLPIRPDAAMHIVGADA